MAGRSRSRTTRSATRQQRDHINETIHNVVTGQNADDDPQSSGDESQVDESPASTVNVAELRALIAEQVTAAVTLAMAGLTTQIPNTARTTRVMSTSSGGQQTARTSTTNGERPADRAPPRSVTSKPVIARFNGRDPQIQVESWLKLFDVAFNDYNDEEKVQTLIRHLDGEAITWFSEEIADYTEEMSWREIKYRMAQRFAEKLVRPIVAAQSRFMNRMDTINSYYSDKMRLLRRVPGLEDLDQVALLTAGVPAIYKTSLMSARVRAPSDWLELALELETVFKYKKPAPRTADKQQTDNHSHRIATRDPQVTFNATAQKDRKKKKPNKPCKYCQEAGVTAYHWHSECERATHVKQTATETMVADSQSADHDSHIALTASGNGGSGRAMH